MKRPSSRVLVGLGLAVLALAAFLGYRMVNRAGNEPLVLYGNIDIREVHLAFQGSGQVQDVLVDEGDTVRAGQVLARLDTAALQSELAEAEAAVGAQKARLSLLRAGSRAEDLAQAKAAVEERRAALRGAQADVTRLTPLHSSGAASGKVLENATSTRDEAAARLRSAEAAWRAARTGARREELQEAQANVDRVEAVADHIRIRLKHAELVAPSNGVILTRAIEKGALVSSNATAFTEALAHPVWARVYVDAPNLGLVAPGTIVQLQTDAAPDKRYRGKVGHVSPTAEFTPKSVETPELRTDLVYRARVVVLNPDSRLRQGMPVTVRFADGTKSLKD
ncbi:MAG TPA: efflux RND transporter periplasmic adaptor subunit [Pseudoxanthomonas sp.]|nr:efflux RND transporter periplasmic adaptor subunit [Pseudoxanthomonas sp.]